MKATLFFTAILLLFTTTALQAQELTPFQDANGKSGFKDDKGKIIIPAKYDYVTLFKDGFAFVNQGATLDDFAYKGGKWGVINEAGKEITPLKFDAIDPFFEGRILFVNVGGSFGFLDDNSGLFMGDGGKWGFINLTDNSSVPPQYALSSVFSEGLASVTLTGSYSQCALGNCRANYGYIDKKGKLIIPFQFETAGVFKDGKAKVIKNGIEFYIDKTGKEIGGNTQSATTTSTKNKPTKTSSSKLSPNFLYQFEDLLAVNWEGVKGEESFKTTSGENEYDIIYKSKKTLDGFKVNCYQYKNKKGERKEVLAELANLNTNAMQLFDKIIDELLMFESENSGYIVGLDTKAPNGTILKKIFVSHMQSGYVEAEILLLKNNIQIIIKKDQKSAMLTNNNTKPTTTTSTTNKTINASTLNQLAGVWSITTKDHVSGITSNHKMEIKIVNGVPEAWRWANGKADIKYTYFKVFEDKSGLSYLFELNVPPGIKSEGTGSINNSIAQMEGTLLITMKNSNIASTHGWTAKKEITTSKPKQAFTRFKDANNKWGFKNDKGDIVVQPIYNNSWDFSEELAGVELKRKWGFVDKTGKVVIPFNYTQVFPFTEGLAHVNINGKHGYIDKTGAVVIQPEYTQTFGFEDGLAAVNLKGKWGFIDKTGKVVIPLQYEYESSFSEGLAGVQLNGKWGYIDKTGKEIIPVQYQSAFLFTNGKAFVTMNGKSFYIDKTGNEVK